MAKYKLIITNLQSYPTQHLKWLLILEVQTRRENPQEDIRTRA